MRQQSEQIQKEQQVAQITELRRIFNVNSNLTTMPCARDAWHFIKSKFLN